MISDPNRWRRVEAICDAALSLSGAERAAFVQSACTGDETLQREVESLLAHDGRAARLRSGAIAAVAADVMGTESGRSLIGQRIGTCDVMSRLGAGGMGEVFRAHDTQLGRDVAIKVLPAAFSADAERLARFEREARVLAALNHPNISTIYGVERVGEIRAIVLEFVDGATLAERLAAVGGRGGLLPLKEALEIARQIADALEAAHDQGIVHRDLKPANIKITPSGLVKVLDFGLAKSDAVPHDSSHSETMTVAGALLGTAAYMSPEQARGQAVDRRADIWAFGCVLYEILTGRVAFAAETVSDHIAAILEREPDWAVVPAHTPPALQRLLHRCLEKDPKRRLRDIADARLEIDEAVTAPATPAVPARWVSLQRGGLAAVLALVAVAGIWMSLEWRRPVAPAESALTRFVIKQPTDAGPVRIPGAPQVAWFDISPDGTEIVYSARRAGVRRLFLRRLDQFDATPIGGTEGGVYPSFSADGQWVAYLAAGTLQKVNVRESTAPIVLCTVPDGFELSWASNAVLFGRRNRPVMRVPGEGGEPQPLTTLDVRQDIDHHTPSELPGGQVLFAIHAGEDRFSVAVESPETHQRKVLIGSGFAPRFVPPGHIVFARGHALYATAFDLRRLEVVGSPVMLVDHVETSSRDGEGLYAVSRNGTLVFTPERSVDGRKLVWVDRGGTETPLPIPPRGFRTPRVSADGRRLAFAARVDDRHDIWAYDIAGDILTRITLEGDNSTPLWTRDSQRLAYTSLRDDGVHLMWQPADGGGMPESLLDGRNLLFPSAWTAGDRELIYVEQPPTDQPWISILSVAGVRHSKRLRSGEGTGPSLSPDGRWLAFDSFLAGSGGPSRQVLVSPFPDVGSQRQLTVDGGRAVKWRQDGRELFYRTQANPSHVFAAAVDATSGFRAAKPSMLFEDRYVNDLALDYDYDVAPDGRFLMIKPSDEELLPLQLNVAVNWREELARRVPVPK